MLKIKNGDTIIVRTGKDRGRIGKIIKVLPKAKKILVEGINLVKKHKKGNPQQNIPSEIREQEAPLDISNVAIYNLATNKGDRVGIKFLEDGRKVRYFKSNNEIIDTEV